MSHELRTPLNAIIGFSEIIKGETFGPAGSVKYRSYAEDINDSGRHLLDLINDILDLSKIESGTARLYENDIRIAVVLGSIRTLIKGRAQKGAVELVFDVRENLPALRADHRKVKQILVNLLANAIKFSRKGDTIFVGARTESEDMGFALLIYRTDFDARHELDSISIRGLTCFLEPSEGVVISQCDGCYPQFESTFDDARRRIRSIGIVRVQM